MAQASAPFTPEQVANIAAWQNSSMFHGYTCSCAERIRLVPEEKGLVCPNCGHIQQDVMTEIANGLPPSLEDFFDAPKEAPALLRIEAIVSDATVRHCNGATTVKDLVMHLQLEMEDDSGKFEGNNMLVLPVPYATPCGDQNDLIGKRIKIVITKM